MKAIYTLLSALCVLCLLPACETVTVSTNHDPAAPFGKYRTYTLAPPAHGQAMSAVAETALRESLRKELASRGLTEASGKKADLDIVRHVFVYPQE